MGPSSKSEPRQRGLVVLLGAGASVEAGISTSRELTKEIYADVREPRSSDYGLILGYVIAKLQARNAKLGLSPYEPIEVEDLFDTLTMLFRRDQLAISEFVERWDSTISEQFVSFDINGIKSAMQTVIGRVTAKQNGFSGGFSPFDREWEELAKALQPRSRLHSPPNSYRDPQQPFFHSLYRHLAFERERTGYLAPLVTSERTRLIATLNYDLTIESVAEQFHLDVDYGLDFWEKQKRVDWRRTKSLKLLKLHGSLNWTGNHEQPKIRRNDIQDRERRIMVFGGTENKLSSTGPFLQFLYRFERSLFNTNALLVVGYSFRDPHINAVLQRWRLNRLDAEMTVIDPTPPRLWEMGFPMQDGYLEPGVGRKKKVKAVRVIKKSASAGIAEFFTEPSLDI